MSDQAIIMDDKLEMLDIRRWREEVGFSKRAEIELGETPEVRARTLRQLAELLRSQTEFRPRMDEDYLLRFLRAKKFDVDRSFKLMRNFYRCRLIAPDKFGPIGVGPLDVKHLFDLRMGIILPKRNPMDGSVVLLASFGDWTPESGYTPMDAYTPISMAFDLVQRNPEAQLYGFRMIIDLAGLQWRYLRFLPPHVIRALVRCLQDGYPARFKGAHIINNSYLSNVLYNMVKPLMRSKFCFRLHMHGTDLTSLHEYISPEILPDALGGMAGEITHHWFTKELYERHDEYVKYSYYGYNVKAHEEAENLDARDNDSDFYEDAEDADQPLDDSSSTKTDENDKNCPNEATTDGNNNSNTTDESNLKSSKRSKKKDKSSDKSKQKR